VRLRRDHRIHARRRQGDRLRLTYDRLDAGRPGAEHREHRRVGLDGHDLVSQPVQQAAERPGARGEVDHAERFAPDEPAGGLGRIRRPDAVVERSGSAERQPVLLDVLHATTLEAAPESVNVDL
jgi:hypothetical protein